jgi:hypothetical protein
MKKQEKMVSIFVRFRYTFPVVFLN